MQRGRVLLLAWAVSWAAGSLAGEVEDLLARAQTGDRAALSALRMRLSESPGTVAEIDRVVEGFRKASIEGDPRAQYEFGYLLEQGLGLPRDYRQAEKWFLAAAGKGHVDAQYRLGRMYHEGTATAPNRRQAYVWLSIAERGGSAPAAALRERAESTLAPGDLAKAKAEVEAQLARLAAPATAPAATN